MQEQPDLEWRRMQAIHELPVIVWIEPLRRLHLDDHDIINDEINPISRDGMTIIEYRHVDLASDFVSTAPQLEHQSRAVDSLQKTEPKLVVNNEEGVND